jgi:hypothetical protein
MLETSLVFLDTQVFVSSNFMYSSGKLKKLLDLSQSGRIRPVTTEITVNEIKANIADQVDIASSVLQRVRDKGRILENALDPSFENIFENYNAQNVLEDLTGQLDKYFREAVFTRLSVDGVPVNLVFAKYFSRQPPFGEKKKSEFPDAFVLESLDLFCREQVSKLYIISADSDFRAACSDHEFFIHLEHIEDLFELIAAEDHELEMAHNLVEAEFKEINDRISSIFVDRGFYLTDQNGDVEETEVIEISNTDLNIIDVGTEHIEFQTTVTIRFIAEVSYEDMDTAIYDSEDKVAYPWQTIEQCIEREAEYSAYGEITFIGDPPRDVKIGSIVLDAPSDVGITVDDWDSHH